MLKKLTRKFVILSILAVAFAAASAAPVQVRAEPECYVCICENGRCFCQRVECPF